MMSKSRMFKLDKQLIRAHRARTNNYDIWIQKNNQKSREVFKILSTALKDISGYEIPRIVIVRGSQMPKDSFSAYDKTSDTIFINNKLYADDIVEEMLSDGYFAARNFRGILIHELVHKKH